VCASSFPSLFQEWAIVGRYGAWIIIVAPNHSVGEKLTYFNKIKNNYLYEGMHALIAFKSYNEETFVLKKIEPIYNIVSNIVKVLASYKAHNYVGYVYWFSAELIAK